MEKLKYREDVDYVMGKYGEYIERAFQVQQGLNSKRRALSNSSNWYYSKEMDNVRDSFTTEMMNVASSLKLNVLLTKIIAQNYVTKNMCFGNEVERVLTDIKRDLGLGMFCFDALSLRDEVYKSNYKEKIIQEVMRQVGDEKKRKLAEEKGVGIVETKIEIIEDSQREIEYENQLIAIGGQEIKEDIEVLGDVIDLIMDGAIPVKIRNIEEDIEQNRTTGNLKGSKLQSEEAEMVKNLEKIYLAIESQALIKRNIEQKVEDYINRYQNNIETQQPFDARIYSPEYEITRKISEGVIRQFDEQKKERTNHLEVNMQQIMHLIDSYVDFLLNDNLFFIEHVIGVSGEKQSRTDDEAEFKVNVQGLKGREAFDLVNFISYYSPKEYESIKKYVLSQINRCKKDEIDLLKRLANEEKANKSCTYAIQRLEKLVDKDTKPKKFERMKKYLMIYYSYRKNDSIFENLSNGISFQKAIAYEFAIRFLSTKTPEQLLDLVKRLEEYEKCEKSFKGLKPEGELKE